VKLREQREALEGRDPRNRSIVTWFAWMSASGYAWRA
jgi:hypothetical protein